MSWTMITQLNKTVNLLVADGVWPYPDLEDKYVVIVGGEEVAWAGTQSQAWRTYNEYVRVDFEHRDHCPEDYIPFDGSAPASNDWSDDYAIEAAI